MPHIHKEKIGEIHKVTTTPTFWERCVEGAKAIGFVLCVLGVLALFFG